MSKHIHGKVVYKHHEFIVIDKGQYFLAVNKRKEFQEGHTHLKTLESAIAIIKNVYNETEPDTRNVYLLKSHVRLSKNRKYRKFIEDIIASIEYGLEPRNIKSPFKKEHNED